jgi:hypothetical protein
MSPVPGKKYIRGGLAAATCSLLGVGSAQAQPSGKSDLESSLMIYTEPGRVSTYELMAHSRIAMPGEKLLRLSLTVDILTGASPNGATPARFVQTFTRPSGKGQYTVPAEAQPLDNTFQDNRGMLDGQLDLPLGRLTTSRIGAHVSVEYDYVSTGARASVSRDFNKKNTGVNAGVMVSYDVIDPEGGAPIAFAPMRDAWQRPFRIPGSQYKTVVDFLAGVNQVINRRTLAQLNYSVSYVDGYQTDPYKMLSVIETTPGDEEGDPLAYVYENRPRLRTKQSVYGWMKRHLSRDIIEGSYRYLWDDWGIQSHTVEMRYMWSFGAGQHIQPLLRFYHQSRADFFEHFLRNDEPFPDHATADYRLNEFNAYTVMLRYGRTLRGGQRVNVRLGYYLQMGDSSPPEAIGHLKELNLFPNVTGLIWQISYLAQF